MLHQLAKILFLKIGCFLLWCHRSGRCHFGGPVTITLTQVHSSKKYFLANLLRNLLAKLVSDSPLATWRVVSAIPAYCAKTALYKAFIYLERGLPLSTYAPRGGGWGQASYTFPLRISIAYLQIACKIAYVLNGRSQRPFNGHIH